MGTAARQPKAKKPRKGAIVYKEDRNDKATELEDFLFGGSHAQKLLLEAGSDDDPDAAQQSLAAAEGDQEGEGGATAPLFFEDRRRAALDSEELSDSDEEEEEEDEAEEEGGEERGQRQKQHALEVEDDEEDEGQRKQQPQEEEKEGEGDEGSSGQEKDERPQSTSPAGTAPGSGTDTATAASAPAADAADAAAAGSRAGGGRKRAAWDDPHDTQLRVDLAGQPRLRKLRRNRDETAVDGLQYEAALRKQHTLLNPRTAWAKPAKAAAGTVVGTALEGSDDEDGGAEALLHRGGSLLASRAQLLPPGLIEVTRLRDANQHEPSNAVVRSVEFHPNGQLMLAAGLDKKLRLFQVDGLRNPKVQTVFLADLPIHRAAFAAGGSVVLASGRRRHCYCYDLHAARVERITPRLEPGGSKSLETFAVSPASTTGEPLVAFLGDQGHVSLMSLRTRQAAGQVKMNGSARCAAFTPDGNQMVTSGGDGVVYTWDMRTRRCLSQLIDEGCIGASSLAVAPDDIHLATGATSGVVNIHRRLRGAAVAGGKAAPTLGPCRPSSTPPVRALLNLTTTVDTLAFSPDSQILALASRMQKDALRLLHVPSLTVFSNWPTAQTPLGHVHSLAFSPGGGFLAVGNARGKVLLYRLHHYQQV